VPPVAEVQLARFGVLMLDEIMEFHREAIRSLAITLRRMHGAPFVVATAIPCPCGWFESGIRQCVCSADAISRYAARAHEATTALGIKITTSVRSLSPSCGDLPPGESSELLRSRIAHERTDKGD
jgi:magnesium chelatase family protein